MPVASAGLIPGSHHGPCCLRFSACQIEHRLSTIDINKCYREGSYMPENNRLHKASCHCGAVELALSMPEGLVDLRRCDCSMCRRRGAIVTSVPLDALSIVKGADALKLYQFNTLTAEHYFCGNCGIYTHHRRRSNPEQYGVNVACLEGVDPYTLGDVPVSDGVNHPADR